MQIFYDIINFLKNRTKPVKKISYLFIILSPLIFFVFLFILLIIRLFNIKIKRGKK